MIVAAWKDGLTGPMGDRGIQGMRGFAAAGAMADLDGLLPVSAAFVLLVLVFLPWLTDDASLILSV